MPTYKKKPDRFSSVPSARVFHSQRTALRSAVIFGLATCQCRYNPRETRRRSLDNSPSGEGVRGICVFLQKTVHLSPLCISDFDKRHRATRVFQFQRDETQFRPSLVSLLRLLLDGSHRRDDCGLGPAGRGGHRNNRGQGRTGGDDGGLGQGHGDGRVPFAFPLLGLGWGEKAEGAWAVSSYREEKTINLLISLRLKCSVDISPDNLDPLRSHLLWHLSQ